jgi:hypothetical protein
MKGQTMMWIRLLLLAGAFIHGCAEARGVSVPAPDTFKLAPQDREDAMVAFFNRIMEEHRPDLRDVTIQCLSVGEYGKSADADTGLINRFAGPGVQIYAASHCGFDIGIGTFEKKTGKRAIIFFAKALRCESLKKCHISGGYLIGNLGGLSRSYFVERSGKGWTVRIDARQPTYIS